MISFKGMKSVPGKSSTQSGFTLLEVLTVLAIVSILGMIAIPFYQDYRTRVKVAGELPLAEPVKKVILEKYLIDGSWPVDNADAKVFAPETYQGDYLQSVEVSDTPQPGSVILTYKSDALPALGTNNTLIFYPKSSPNSRTFNWGCDQGTIDSKYRPKSCR